jgi:hypothetical protein
MKNSAGRQPPTSASATALYSAMCQYQMLCLVNRQELITFRHIAPLAQHLNVALIGRTAKIKRNNMVEVEPNTPMKHSPPHPAVLAAPAVTYPDSSLDRRCRRAYQRNSHPLYRRTVTSPARRHRLRCPPRWQYQLDQHPDHGQQTAQEHPGHHTAALAPCDQAADDTADHHNDDHCHVPHLASPVVLQ